MDDRFQQLDSNSFFVNGIGDLPESKLCDLLCCTRVKVYSWELTGEKRRFCEAFFNSTSQAEQVYNSQNPVTFNNLTLKFLPKHAMTSVWVTGLPGIVYSRDLFTGLNELTAGLLRVTIPPNPEIPGISSLGIAILTYSSNILAEEALNTFKTPTRLYNQNYRVFVNREIQAMWAEPFYDLLSTLSKESRFIILTGLSPNTSTRQVEEEVSCFGNIERIRRFANSAVVVMKTVNEGKNLIKSGSLYSDGKKWKVKPAARLNEDPQEPDLYRNMKHQAPRSSGGFNSNEAIYELSVLQLCTGDRQRLYEVVQSAPAFPCVRDNNIKGMSLDLINKARKLLNQSRRPADDFLLNHDKQSYEPVKKPKVETKYDSRVHERYQDTHQTRMIETNPPAYMPYSPSPIITHNDRNTSHTPENLQNLTMDQKMQYYYYLNNPTQYYPYGNYNS